MPREVNRVSSADAQQGGKVYVRPHDLELLDEPQRNSLPAVLKRLTHLGRDLYAELILESGEKSWLTFLGNPTTMSVEPPAISFTSRRDAFAVSAENQFLPVCRLFVSPLQAIRCR